jgi:hypothetical protein
MFIKHLRVGRKVRDKGFKNETLCDVVFDFTGNSFYTLMVVSLFYALMRVLLPKQIVF